MGGGAGARVALWCAVVAGGLLCARAFTVDCNHEYTDCDTELSKLGVEDEDLIVSSTSNLEPVVATPKPFLPTIPPEPPIKGNSKPEGGSKDIPSTTEATKAPENTEIPKQPRLLNLNVDENLQNFANALHNQTKPIAPKIDLSDVNMEEEEEDPTRIIAHDHSKHGKPISNQFYAHLQVPFNPLLGIDHTSDEQDTCKENEVVYKVGERIDRGCEETCECHTGGIFDCSPRCKHPYIRKGRRLNDPLCFESPVDECCSIIACSTGNQDVKTKIEVCRYNNETHTVGEKWHIGCDQTCSCEANSVVTCRPRCKKLIPSEKCINVQDPHDECCEVQVCDVSQDVHEEPENVTSSTTSTTTPRIFIETGIFDDQHTRVSEELITSTSNPIGSVKVLQNNSVQVNLIHMNSSESPILLQLSSDGGKNFNDVELKHSNLILNLPGGKDYILKSRESGNKFNFTITASIDTENGTVKIEETKEGCYHHGKFYTVGEEYHIGCSQICECTGLNTSDCVELVCPSHVGLELVSKGCVRWAPSPPAVPPNCCPRSARCLSDGTCHYKGIAVPNWTEVPILLTGCEQRCFCENGELDCQEVCTPLPPVPPQTLRCPPQHHPAPMNISDEDCCQQWGCMPNAETISTTSTTKILPPTLKMETYRQKISVPPITTTTEVITTTVDSYNHYRQPSKIINFITPSPFSAITKTLPMYPDGEERIYSTKGEPENITFFTFQDLDKPIKIIQAEPHTQTDPYVAKIHSLLMNLKNEKEKKTHRLLIGDDQEIQFHEIQPKLHNSNSDHKAQNVIEPSYLVPALNKKMAAGSTYFVPSITDHDEIYILQPPVSTRVQNMFTPLRLPNKSQEYINDSQFLLKQSNINNIVQSNKPFNEMKLTDFIHKQLMTEETTTTSSSHLLYKLLKPYETVLMKPVRLTNYKIPRIHSPLGLEQLVSQMELESEVNRNLGRSADSAKIVKLSAGKQTPAPDLSTSMHGQAPFLPTVPPMIHFPTEDIPDYDQNNLHRPINARDPTLPGIATGLNAPASYGEENKKLLVLSILSDSPTSIKLLFGLPQFLVGLRGSVDLRYTDKADEDISQWYSQVFAPADEILTTARLEFRLTGLKPSTIYKIKGKLFLHNLPVEPESQVYSVRTLDLPSVIPPIEEKKREVDSRLVLVDVNDTAAHISWRHFSEDELEFIDGIQVRYRPVGTPIYSMTELLHHSRTIAELHDLRPGTKYEASLVLIPPPRTTTELYDPRMVQFTTAPFVDLYNWTVTIEAHVVGSDAAELTWHGVPSPAERWVRVYRAAHACGATRHEHDAFRLAARDLPPTIRLSGLEANTRCRVWMELFLTNGKIKTSNVLEINTRPEESPDDIDNEIDTGGVAGTVGARGGGRGDYYGALVVVGVVAALGALTSLLLLLVLVRRHRPRSVPITPVPTAPRESSLPPYDNPAYKLELQQETMDL